MQIRGEEKKQKERCDGSIYEESCENECQMWSKIVISSLKDEKTLQKSQIVQDKCVYAEGYECHYDCAETGILKLSGISNDRRLHLYMKEEMIEGICTEQS